MYASTCALVFIVRFPFMFCSRTHRDLLCLQVVFRSCCNVKLCFYFSVASSVFLLCFSLAVIVYSLLSFRVFSLFFYSSLPFCSIFPSFTITIAVCSVVLFPSFSAFVLLNIVSD